MPMALGINESIQEGRVTLSLIKRKRPQWIMQGFGGGMIIIFSDPCLPKKQQFLIMSHRSSINNCDVNEEMRKPKEIKAFNFQHSVSE